MRKKFIALFMTFCMLVFCVQSIPPIEANALGQQNILSWNNPGFYTYTIPRSGIWELECWGASGGSDGGGPGGAASYRSGFFKLEKGTVIRICVGAQGWSGGSIGFNKVGGGGGTGGVGWSGSGGGATYVVTGSSNYLWDYGYNNNDILVVAGGGGGGTAGVEGGHADVYCGGGAMGYGGSRSDSEDGGGGGGGYQGGNAADDRAKTGGGTSYVNTNRGYTGTWNKGSYYGSGSFRISLHGYYIHFDPNVPSITESKIQGYMEDQYMIYGVPDYLHKNQYSLKGYIWEGWTANPDGSGQWYNDEQFVID